jgi:hypothetical protein
MICARMPAYITGTVDQEPPGQRESDSVSSEEGRSKR